MPVNEKDFLNMYMDGGPTIGDEEGTPSIPESDLDTVVPEVSGDELVQAAAAVPAEITEEVPAEAVTPEEVIEGEQPAEEVAEVTEEVPAETSEEASGEELQKMLDALGLGVEEGTQTTEEIKTVAEEVKSSISPEDEVSQKKMDDLLIKVAELEANDLRKTKTIEVIRREYDKTLNEKLSLEYGTANDSKVATIVNEDPDIKTIMAAKMALDKNGDKEALIQAYKSALENITGQSFDAVMKAQKEQELAAFSTEESAGLQVPATAKEDSIYV